MKVFTSIYFLYTHIFERFGLDRSAKRDDRCAFVLSKKHLYNIYEYMFLLMLPLISCPAPVIQVGLMKPLSLQFPAIPKPLLIGKSSPRGGAVAQYLNSWQYIY